YKQKCQCPVGIMNQKASFAMGRQTSQPRAEDKCMFWTAQVEWWERWANDHGLSVDAANCASIHLSFMQDMATQAAQEQQLEEEPKTVAFSPSKAKKSDQEE
ncbi:hypothetical protein F441_08516, partial [Phytophthora nicotianae CJ01A1]